jgi:hypothetical protein
MTPRREPPRGRRTNPLHVVWVASADPERDAARLGALLRVDAYEAGVIVRGRGPRVLRTLGDAAEADEIHERARRMGLRTFLIDEIALATRPPVEAVEAVRRDSGAPVLLSASGPLRLAPGAVDLLVAARVPVRRQRVTRRITMLPTEAGATPGLPRVVKRSQTVQDHPGVLDVYPAGREVCLRAREEALDFSGFRQEGGASALIHFARLIEEARAAAPDAPFDDRFARFDDGDAAHPGRTDVRPGVAVLDGVARFERYSRILWRARRDLGWPASA